MTPIRRSHWLALAWAVVCSVAIVAHGARPAGADPIPQGWEASNMYPVGYSDLNGRGGAFKLSIRHVNGHWYLYMGHLWNNGWTILDVTDPSAPHVANFIPGPANTSTIQMTMHDNLMVTALEQPLRGWGGDPDQPYEEGVLLWDIHDPIHPKLLSHWKTGAGGTHRNSYPGGKYAYLSAHMAGFKDKILIILDVSDPLHPKEAGRWWMPGQKAGEPLPTGPIGFHGPAMISPDGKIATMGYAPDLINLDISDPTHPTLIGKLQLSPPFIQAGAQSEHSALPIPGTGLVHMNSEQAAEDCSTDALDLAALIDNSNMAKPRLISVYPIPQPPADAPYTSFCQKGGRFGPHNTNQEQHLPDVEKQAKLIYLTYFNAGLRIFDIKDPYRPVESGWFIPPQPTKRIGPKPSTKLVNQTEDVLVDTRGYIYITDKQWGVFILRYAGPDEPAPTATSP